MNKQFTPSRIQRMNKVSRTKRFMRVLGISICFISGGLVIVAFDQVGHYLQSQRAGFHADAR